MIYRLFIFNLLFMFCYISKYSQATGDIKINRTDAKGNKQGYWRKIDVNGHLKYEGKFIDNIPVDTFKYYYINGKLESEMIYDVRSTNYDLNLKSKIVNRKSKFIMFYR